MKRITDAAAERVLIFDGSKGYMLQKEGLSASQSGEVWNITRPEVVTRLYQKYKDAGADVIQTNTFGATREHLKPYGYEEFVQKVNESAVQAAKQVMGDSGYVAASVGPIGRMMEPMGDLSFEEAYELFKEQAYALVRAGVDAVHFETFTDIAELRAAILALRTIDAEVPVLATVAFEENNRTLMGSSADVCACMLKALGCDMIGANCSFGPSHMVHVIEQMGSFGVPVVVKPNAGMPIVENGQVRYAQQPDEFAKECEAFIPHGAVLIGGCCGTDADFVKELHARFRDCRPIVKPAEKEGSICSTSVILSENQRKEAKIYEWDLEEDANAANAFLKADPMDLMTMAMDIQEHDSQVVRFTPNSRASVQDTVKAFDHMQSYFKKPVVFAGACVKHIEALLRIYRGRAGVECGSKDQWARVMNMYGALYIHRQ